MNPRRGWNTSSYQASSGPRSSVRWITWYSSPIATSAPLDELRVDAEIVEERRDRLEEPWRVARMDVVARIGDGDEPALRERVHEPLGRLGRQDVRLGT